ncbi:unnamed protein product [Choristocarpus tenellus]
MACCSGHCHEHYNRCTEVMGEGTETTSHGVNTKGPTPSPTCTLLYSSGSILTVTIAEARVEDVISDIEGNIMYSVGFQTGVGSVDDILRIKSNGEGPEVIFDGLGPILALALEPSGDVLFSQDIQDGGAGVYRISMTEDTEGLLVPGDPVIVASGLGKFLPGLAVNNAGDIFVSRGTKGITMLPVGGGVQVQN